MVEIDECVVEIAEKNEDDHNFPQVSDLVAQENYSKFSPIRNGSLISSIKNKMGIA